MSQGDSFEISLLASCQHNIFMSQSYPSKPADCFIYGQKKKTKMEMK